MGFILENSAFEIVCASLFIFWYVFYSYVTEHYNYWKTRQVPHVKAVFPLGSLPAVALGQCQIALGYDKCYKEFKQHRYFGVLEGRKPTLVVNDPELIKCILTKDFSSFTDRIPIPESQKNQYIIQHLFNMTGQDWRRMRLLLAPTFTSGKMKNMFFLTEKCCDQLQVFIKKSLETDTVIDIKDTLAKFTMDIIATCAFGLDLNSITDNNCEFFSMATNVTKTDTLRIIRRLWYGLVPILSKLYAPEVVDPKVTQYFTKIVRDAVIYREEKSVFRNDFLDLLIKIRQNKSLKEDGENPDEDQPGMDEKKLTKNKVGITIEEITAQSFVFFLAGFETASSTTSFALYQLACNRDIQEKLYEEIKRVLGNHGGKPTYQALQEMTYMEQVIKETLRLYPSLGILYRTCTESYKVPDSSLIVVKGTRIVIPISAIHHDPKYYPEPYKFDPERFTAEQVKERHPYLHLPFGEGPRMCIGMRFGMMQTKIGLATMLYNYEFGVNEKTDIPLKIHKKAFVTIPEKPMILSVKKRT